jgi:Ser/Thr protein kinase RdoA (MazF antagonist)
MDDKAIILQAFGIDSPILSYRPLGHGLIHATWQITTADNNYVLQRLNTSVFTNPQAVADNIRSISDHLAAKNIPQPFLQPIATKHNGDLLPHEGQVYRLFYFINGGHSLDAVDTPQQAYEAARQFGRFTQQLYDMNVEELHITLPFFHDLGHRCEVFRHTLLQGDPDRLLKATSLIETLKQHNDIEQQYHAFVANPDCLLRVTHHDTKISNVLLNEKGQGLAVIDLDTVMPGYFISDIGDMFRTYLSPAGEEERDLDKLSIRADVYSGIVQGYLAEMGHLLTQAEYGYIYYAGRFMLYMQAIRFLTDYLLNDRYYGESYPHHNYYRAANQVRLLELYTQQEQELSQMVNSE